MKKIFYPILLILLMVSCHQKSWEERCSEEALEYTLTHCPLDVGNGIRLDSLTYNAATNTNTYYYIVNDVADNDSFFQARKADIENDFLSAIASSIDLKPKKEHGTKLQYIYHSGSTKKKLFDCTFGPNETGGYGKIK